MSKALLFGLPGLLATSLWAQAPQKPSGNTPAAVPGAAAATAGPETTIKAKAQVVLLDVIAADKHGVPITDLKPEDFTVLERGKPQQLASFNLVDLDKRRAALANAQVPKIPPGVYTNKQTAAEKENQLIVLLLDALNTQWKDQAYARNQMLNFIKKNKQTGQKMAIYGLTSRLIRLQDFTDDPVLLQRVLEGHRGRSSPLLDSPSDPQVDTSQMTDEMAASLQQFQETEAAFRMDMRVEMTLDALTNIGRALAGYQGRKKLIWISSSFPITLEPGEAAGFGSQRNYSDEVIKATNLLRDAQVSVYPVDAQGLFGLSTYDAQSTGRGTNGRMMNGPQMASATQRELSNIANTHFSAQALAEGTGGLAFYNRNDLDTAVAKSVADGAVYYALSYSPTDKKWDGQYRKIEVKVNRPGVALRYRKGYFARDPDATPEISDAAVQDDIDGAMMTLLTSTSVTFYGSALPLEAPKNGPMAQSSAVELAEVRFLVEPRDILFEPAEDRRHCSLNFAVGVFSNEKLVNSVGKKVDCNVKPDTYARLMKKGITFQLPVELKADKVRLRLLVRDNLSGKMGSVDVPYPPVVPQAGSAQPAKP